MTIDFLKILLKNNQMRHFLVKNNQIRQILQLDEFKGADFKLENSFIINQV